MRKESKGKEGKKRDFKIFKWVQLKCCYHRKIHPVLCVLLVVHLVAWWVGMLAVEEERHKQ